MAGSVYIFTNNSDDSIAAALLAEPSQGAIESCENNDMTYRVVNRVDIEALLVQPNRLDTLASSAVRLVTSDDPVGFTLIYEHEEPQISFDDYVRRATAEFIMLFESARAQISGANDRYENADYITKGVIAKRVIDGEASTEELSWVQAEVDQRAISGETVELLAAKQLDKANRQKLASAYTVGGLQKRMKLLLLEAATEAQIDAVITQAGLELDDIIAEIQAA